MKIIEAYPPNIEKIRQVIVPPHGTVFAYGESIYNPDKIKIYPDLYLHEETHQKQQKEFGNTELWWDKYLLDRDFREIMEVQAYSNQLKFLKEEIPNHAIKELLFEMSEHLSRNYELGISVMQAHTKIRKSN